MAETEEEDPKDEEEQEDANVVDTTRQQLDQLPRLLVVPQEEEYLDRDEDDLEQVHQRKQFGERGELEVLVEPVVLWDRVAILELRPDLILSHDEVRNEVEEVEEVHDVPGLGEVLQLLVLHLHDLEDE